MIVGQHVVVMLWMGLVDHWGGYLGFVVVVVGGVVVAVAVVVEVVVASF